jgi:hypothetical protein
LCNDDYTTCVSPDHQALFSETRSSCGEKLTGAAVVVFGDGARSNSDWIEQNPPAHISHKFRVPLASVRQSIKMKNRPMLRILIIAIPAILVILFVIVSLQPSNYRVSRSLSIGATPETVFPHLNELKKWAAWNPWGKADPNIKRTFGGPEAGVGSICSWIGNSQVGEGRATIVASRPVESIKIKMEWVKPMPGISEDEFTFTPQGNQTQVTWTMSGHKNFMMKAFCLFRSMDQMVGGKFEQGLADLKTTVEDTGK